MEELDDNQAGDIPVKVVLGVLAAIFLGIFVVVWVWIAVELWQFTPTDSKKRLDLDEGLVSAAALLATSVGAGTAAVLGIEIKEQRNNGRTFFGSLANAALSPFIFAGVLVYAAVGVGLMLVWLANRSVSPDVVQAFALGVLGWLAGAFSAVFRAATT